MDGTENEAEVKSWPQAGLGRGALKPGKCRENQEFQVTGTTVREGDVKG